VVVAVVVLDLILLLAVLVVLAAVVLVTVQEVLLQLVVQTPVVAVAVVVTVQATNRGKQVDQVLSLFAIQIQALLLPLQLVLRPLLFLVAIVSINGLLPAQLRSEVTHGSLCTTR
jgi:hypothetical protein